MKINRKGLKVLLLATLLIVSALVYNDSQAAVLAESMEIYTGWNHAFVKMPDGRWQAWGLNTSGQLGNGTTTNALKPIRVNVPTGTKKIVAGESHSVALTATGEVWVTGGNTYGQLELGHYSNVTSWTKISQTGVKDVTASRVLHS